MRKTVPRIFLPYINPFAIATYTQVIITSIIIITILISLKYYSSVQKGAQLIPVVRRLRLMCGMLDFSRALYIKQQQSLIENPMNTIFLCLLDLNKINECLTNG